MQADVRRHREPENAVHSITQELLHASKKDCNDSRNRFIPRAELINLITVGRVAEILQSIGTQEEDVDHLQVLAQNICPNPGRCSCGQVHCTGRRMICAILLLCGREYLIPAFCCEQDPPVCDNHLPLNSDSFDDKFRHDLSEPEKEIFIHIQWQMYTPFITEFDDENNTFKEFPDEVSLPWMSKERLGEPIVGERSHVDLIEIYLSSHNLVSSSIVYVFPWLFFHGCHSLIQPRQRMTAECLL